MQALKGNCEMWEPIHRNFFGADEQHVTNARKLAQYTLRCAMASLMLTAHTLSCGCSSASDMQIRITIVLHLTNPGRSVSLLRLSARNIDNQHHFAACRELQCLEVTSSDALMAGRIQFTLL